MQDNANPSASLKSIQPDTRGKRIPALDVVRGIALIGVMVMNIEYFNRPIAEFGTGIQAGLTGGNWWVAWFVQYFVAGKGWTSFSLLFGMSFAVMLNSAEANGRNFIVTFSRRIVALAVFGSLHHIFLWGGDILVDYAFSACMLMIVLYGRAKYIALAIVAAIGFGFVPGLDSLWDIAGGLVFFSLVAWWLRGESRMGKLRIPMAGFALCMLGTLGILIAAITFMVFKTPPVVSFFALVIGSSLTLCGILTIVYHEPRAARPWRLGTGIYVLSVLIVTAAAGATYLFPDNPPGPDSGLAGNPQKPAATSPVAGAEAKSGAVKEAPQGLAARAVLRATHEASTLRSGAYHEVVSMRAKQELDHYQDLIGFSSLLTGMFLIGYWFIRSGVIANIEANLPLFRKMAIYGIPSGIGLGFLGAAIALNHIPGRKDGFEFSAALLMLGNLPTSLGYFGALVWMLHGNSVLKYVRVFAPLGQMALTNYLAQSFLASTFFYGYGMGHWGYSRIEQLYFVAVTVMMQLAFSYFWISRFCYGPIEWLWRAITYWTIPPLRRRIVNPEIKDK